MRARARAGVLAALLAVGLLPLARAEAAADYPRGAVRVIVGFAPGGSVDVMARFVGKKLSEKFGQPFVIENRAGAGGNIGAGVVAKARPDGQTLLVTSVAHSINPSLYPSLPFDPVKDFAAVGPVGLAPNCIAVNAKTPFKTLSELVAYAKEHPGKVTYSSAGGATTMYLGMAQFEAMAGIRMQHIPYNGTAPSILAAVAGQVDVLSGGYGSAEPYAKSGQLRILGISTAQPSTLAPGVPTIAAAAGVPGYEVVNWIGVLAPAGTPQPILDKLSAAMHEIEQQPDVRKWMKEQGVEPYFLPPAAFGDLVREDVGRYRKIVEASGAKLQ
jgi:tripartite-type tricarboxylate transporter receptor subunit TctC